MKCHQKYYIVKTKGNDKPNVKNVYPKNQLQQFMCINFYVLVFKGLLVL